MKRFKILLLIIVLTLCACSPVNEPVVTSVTTAYVTEEVTEPIVLSSELLECRYYNEESFLNYGRKSTAYETDGKILCGVVPHHLTAGHIIAGFMKSVAESGRNIETVVIIAPMHYENYDTLCTTDSHWNSPYGTVKTDTEITAVFRDKLGAKVNDEMIMHDHSASAHIPFINYYLPEVKTACLLVSKNEAEDIPERLAEILKEISEEKECLFLFSIDFSHFLTPDTADEMDSITRKAVLSGNVAEVKAMNDDNVDSPYCLSTYMLLSDLLGGKITEADNTNSYRILEKPYGSDAFPEGVTSYFAFITTEE